MVALIVIILLIICVITGFSFSPIAGISASLVLIAVIYSAYNSKKDDEITTILDKYKAYLTNSHPDIPEKYHKAIISKITDMHKETFKDKVGDRQLSAEQLDEIIDEFMKDPDSNLRAFAKKSLE